MSEDDEEQVLRMLGTAGNRIRQVPTRDLEYTYTELVRRGVFTVIV